MDKAKVRDYIRYAIGALVSMVIGSLITIFIKDENYIESDFKISSEYKEFAPLYEAYETIKSEYYTDVNEKELVEGAISGMLESIGDKHTMYFDKKSKEDFDAELSGSYYGIGAQIQLTTNCTFN